MQSPTIPADKFRAPVPEPAFPAELEEIHKTLIVEGMGTMTELQVMFARPDLADQNNPAYREGEEYECLDRESQIEFCRFVRESLRRLGKFREDA